MGWWPWGKKETSNEIYEDAQSFVLYRSQLLSPKWINICVLTNLFNRSISCYTCIRILSRSASQIVLNKSVQGHWKKVNKYMINHSVYNLCDPIDGNPSGSSDPGVLQARILEWVAISFSNAWKWRVKEKSFSHVQLFVTPWTVAHQAPASIGFSRQEYWSGLPLSSPKVYKVII